MATLTVRTLNAGTPTLGATVTYTGLVATTYPSAVITAADQFLNDGRTFIWIANASGATRVCTVVSQKKSDMGSTVNMNFSIPTATSMLIGPFPIAEFNDAGGYVQLTHDGTNAAYKCEAISLAEKARG